MKNSLYSVLIAGVFLLAGCAKDGDPGPAGSNGVNGQQGKDGEKGAQGVQGTPGVTGLQGPKGDPGTNGTNGTNGSDGTNGTNGTNGTDANVKVFFFDNQPGSAWTGTVVGTDSSAKWTLSLNNAAFTQAFKDTAGIFIYKKGADGVSRVLPLINGQKQETFEMPSGNNNIDVVVNRFDDKAFERPSAASYRVVLAYKSFIKLHPEIDWNSERSVMAALRPRNGN